MFRPECKLFTENQTALPSPPLPSLFFSSPAMESHYVVQFGLNSLYTPGCLWTRGLSLSNVSLSPASELYSKQPSLYLPSGWVPFFLSSAHAKWMKEIHPKHRLHRRGFSCTSWSEVIHLWNSEGHCVRNVWAGGDLTARVFLDTISF